MSVQKRTTHFRGRVVSLTVDEVVLPNGNRVELELVHHPGGAVIAAVDSRRQVCLLRQYRHAVGEWVWELPAGKLEPGEPALETARRELVEEAGVSARNWRSLGAYFSSPGVFTEILHLFLATDLEPARAAPESSEVFEVRWMPLEEALRWVFSGEIRDAKTALGLLQANHALGAQASYSEKSVTDSVAGPARQP